MTDYPIKWRKTSNGYDKNMAPTQERESFALIYPTGAVEGWRTPNLGGADPMWAPTGYYGGIEVHSKYPLYDDHESRGDYCEWTRGDCYHDGSGLAFERIADLFDDPADMFEVLAEWAKSRLGEVG